MRLAVSQVSRRRTDQLGNLVRVLKLGAIDLDAGAGIAEQRFGHGFDHARLAGTGRPQKQQVAYRPSRRVQPGQKHLVDFGYLFDGLFLADDLAAQGGFEVTRIVAPAGRVEHGCEIRSHRVRTHFLSWNCASWGAAHCWLPAWEDGYGYRSPRPLYSKRFAIPGRRLILPLPERFRCR